MEINPTRVSGTSRGLHQTLVAMKHCRAAIGGFNMFPNTPCDVKLQKRTRSPGSIIQGPLYVILRQTKAMM